MHSAINDILILMADDDKPSDGKMWLLPLAILIIVIFVLGKPSALL